MEDQADGDDGPSGIGAVGPAIGGDVGVGAESASDSALVMVVVLVTELQLTRLGPSRHLG